MVSFIKYVIGYKATGLANLRNLAEIPSCPVAFFELILIICLLTKLSLIGLKSKTVYAVLFSRFFYNNWVLTIY